MLRRQHRFSLSTHLRLFPLCLRDSLVVSVATVSGIERGGSAIVDPFNSTVPHYGEGPKSTEAEQDSGLK